MVRRETLAAQDLVSTHDVLRPVYALTAVTAVAAVATGAFAPPDAVQGQWMRLMYLHVPAAWLAYLAFAVVAGSGVAHLRSRSAASDRWAQAAAEVGTCATALTLVTGSVWGRAVWGVWWAWDARLVSTAAMLLLYTAVLAMRALDPTSARQRLRTAVAGVLAFSVVPVVHFSVLWWSTLHQRATIMGAPGQAPPIDPRMALALSLSVVAVSAVGLVAMVLRVERLAGRRSGRPKVPNGEFLGTSAEGAR